MNAPYLQAGIVWTPTDTFETGGAYTAKIAIDGIDDAVAERVRSYRLQARYKPSPWAGLTLAYERSHNEYVYYLYERRRRSVSLSMEFGTEKTPRFELSYTRTLQAETDPGSGFRANTFSARLNTTF